MMRDATKNFGKIVSYTVYPELNSILKKALNSKDFKPMSNLIVTQNKFNLEKLYNDFPKYRKIIGSDGRERRLTTKIFEQLDVFKESSSKKSAEIIGLIRNDRVKRFLPQKYLDKHENFEKYKVLLPKSNGEGILGEELSSPFVCLPSVGYTQSFIGIGAFDSKREAESCLKYIKSKYARAMLGILKVTQDNSRDVWRDVPLQDFSNKSDIIWSKSITKVDEAAQKKYKLDINEIDAQLYKKYKLSKEEITFIETHVKEMK